MGRPRKLMDDRRYPKIILEGGVGGRRRRGRPRTRWNDCIEKNVKELTDSEETWQEIAENRPRWRGLCKAAISVARCAPSILAKCVAETS